MMNTDPDRKTRNRKFIEYYILNVILKLVCFSKRREEHNL